MTTETEKEVDPKRRVKRLRADHNFHPTISLLDKAMRFHASAKLARENNKKVMEDAEAKRMARELVRHAKHWYVKWNEYRTNLKMPPDEDELGEVAKTRNGEVVQAAKGLGWAIQRGESTKLPAKRLLQAALRLKSDAKANRERREPESFQDTGQPHPETKAQNRSLGS